ncbi:MAG TPA: hypothetical protein VGF07_13215 [Stellaceae bacterium]|jgi:hypothetical protein
MPVAGTPGPDELNRDHSKDDEGGNHPAIDPAGDARDDNRDQGAKHTFDPRRMRRPIWPYHKRQNRRRHRDRDNPQGDLPAPAPAPDVAFFAIEAPLGSGKPF